MLKSLREYALAVGKAWWSLGPGVVAVVLGLIERFSRVEVPTWVWLALAGVAVVVAQFQAFHRIRIDRDALVEESTNAATKVPPDVLLDVQQRQTYTPFGEPRTSRDLVLIGAGGSDAFNVRITSHPKNVQFTRNDLLPLRRLAVGQRYVLPAIRPPVKGSAQEPFVVEWEDAEGNPYSVERYPSQL